MSNAKLLWTLLSTSSRRIGEQIKNIHTACMFQQRALPKCYEGKNIETSLWLTSLPSKRKRKLGKKNIKKKSGPLPLGPLVISCKRKEFNYYSGMTHGKFDEIPLASKAWKNKKSNGDYFTILPVSDHPAFIVNASEKLPVTFDEIGIVEEIKDQLKKMNILYPTTIQAKALPLILSGTNALVTAETGCGKTLAYLIPMVQNILRWKRDIPPQNNSPFGLIILPTRELAIQVGTVARKLCSDLGLTCLTLLGGKTKAMLLDPAINSVDILVCTLGVIRKMMIHHMYSMDLCKMVVVDEADTLLDDSFSDGLKFLFKKSQLRFADPHRNMPNTAQLCLVSATMPTNLESILESVVPLNLLEEVSTNYLHKIQPHIPQHFIRLSKSRKPEELLKLVQKSVKQNSPTMIFSNRTKTTNWLSLFLNENGIKSIRINGAMKSEERLKQYQSFREGLVDVIAATDVTSRGLDCTRVKHVINYEFPRFMADYVHRCGRTGRIGHVEGCQITNFISCPSEIALVQEIEKAVRTQSKLKNVNNNITKIIENRILRKSGGQLFHQS